MAFLLFCGIGNCCYVKRCRGNCEAIPKAQNADFALFYKQTEGLVLLIFGKKVYNKASVKNVIRIMKGKYYET